MTPELALMGALTAILKADAAVTAVAGKRIYDEVPAGRSAQDKPPYIYVGPMRRQRVALDCAQIWTVQARIYVVSTEFGRRESWNLVEAVVQALDRKEAPAVAIPAPFSLQQPLQIVQAGDVVDPLAPKSVFLDLSTTIAREA